LVVSIDSHGNSLNQTLLKKVYSNVKNIYFNENIETSRTFVKVARDLGVSRQLVRYHYRRLGGNKKFRIKKFEII
jgi:hypothetical protein